MSFRNSQRSEATTNRYLAAFSHVFTVAVKDWGWLEDSPTEKVSKLKESRGRVRYLNADERAKLLEACRESLCPYLYTIVVLALSTGLRKNEILHLKWSDVDLVKGRAIIEETKNGKRHAIPLVGHALDTIRKLSEERKNISPLLFPSNNLLIQRPYEIRTAWENALKRAGIDNFRFHDLRHDRASTLASGGASLAQIAEVLNHKSMQMTKRYSHLTEGNVAGILEN